MVNTAIKEGSTSASGTLSNKTNGYRNGLKQNGSKVESPKTNGLKANISDKHNSSSEYTYIKQSDKLSYNICVMILLITAYLLGSSPGSYFLYWVVLFQALLYVKKYFIYKAYGYHYYMIDYCYAAYLFQSAFIMFYPGSRYCYLVSFALSGLVFAAFLYKNMYVFHSMDKMSSAILHSLPLIISWNIHWNIRGTQESKEWGFYDPSDIEFSFDVVYEYYISLTQYYIIYIIFYYGVQYMRWSVIVENDYYCNYRTEATDPKSLLYKLRHKYGETNAILIFMVAHYGYALFYATSMLPLFFLSSLHVAYILYLVYYLINRAGSYYIDFFPQQYEKSLKEQVEQGKDYCPYKTKTNSKTENS